MSFLHKLPAWSSNTGVTTLERTSSHNGQRAATNFAAAGRGAKPMTVRTVNIFSHAAMKVVLLAAVIAVTLLAGTQSDGKASAAANDGVEAVFGNVVAVAAPDSLTVATDGGVVKLLFNADTTLTGQGIESLGDVAEGDRIVATVSRQSAFLFSRSCPSRSPSTSLA